MLNCFGVPTSKHPKVRFDLYLSDLYKQSKSIPSMK